MKIGRANLTLKTTGCIDCGTEYSHAWETARIVTVRIDGHAPHEITVHRCGTCAGIPHTPANVRTTRAASPLSGDERRG